MPAKGRRTASRQGQLKRNKAQKGPSGIPTAGRGVTVPSDNANDVVPAGMSEAELEPSVNGGTSSITSTSTAHQTTKTPSPARVPRGEFVGQGQNRLRGERPATYLYVGAEFRRIVMLTSVIFAALVVLGIVL